jgi:hypothetical protein
MDPITLIVTALAAGATAAVKDVSGEAIKDAYQGLKRLVRRRLAGDTAAEVALDKHADKPEVWEPPLKDALSQAEADKDREIITAAQRLMTLLEPEQAAAGTFTTNVSGDVQGLVQGNHSTVTKTFGHEKES